MKRLNLIIVMLCAAFIVQSAVGHEFRRAFTLEDARGATCRVCVNGARGTGFFVGVEDGYACIFTNFHVVDKNQVARCDFWTNGYMESVTGRIVWRAYDLNKSYDFAQIRVPVDDLAKIDPAWLQFGGSDATPAIGSIIISSGAPDGRFPQAWKGQILEYYNGKTAVFSPPPVPGQSGSPICEYIDNELFVTGILTWLFGEKGRDDSKGGAIPVANLYKALGKRGANVDYHDDASPVPPNATECAEKTAVSPCILEFTQDDCPPCLEAQRDIEFLRALNVPVYVYDVASEAGSEYVKRYGVERTPTFILLDKDFKPVQTFVGAGKSEEIRTAFEKTKAQSQVQTQDQSVSSSSSSTVEKSQVVNEGNQGGDVPGSELPPVLSDSGRVASPSVPSVINLPELVPLPEKLDFRLRPPVYESAIDVGIFDDAENHWQELKRRRNKGSDDDQSKDEDQAEKEEKARPRLKDKLQDGTSEIIGQSINKAIENLKLKMKEKWEAVKFAVLMGFCLILAVALLIAQGIAVALKWAFRKIYAKFKEVRSALEKLRQEESSSSSSDVAKTAAKTAQNGKEKK